MSKEGFIPYQRTRLSDREMIDRSLTFFNKMDKRRSVREFSDAPIADEVIDNIIRTASTAPSGAHKQPWTFCVVKDPEIKKAIRIAAEKEEKISYEQRMPQDWLDDLAPLGTDWHKPFLEIATALIVVFKRNYEYLEDRKANNYYVSESVGLATGLLIAAIHNAGLVTLTHTPSPMNFLKEILQRPDNEKPFLLLPVGKPMEGTMVPKLERKPLSEVMVRY